MFADLTKNQENQNFFSSNFLKNSAANIKLRQIAVNSTVTKKTTKNSEAKTCNQKLKI